ncbi:MAG: OmpA family protein [Chitinispirillaceae bacterium]|nr:OmpA family protein [Chitinispirillaceae bacterium]
MHRFRMIACVTAATLFSSALRANDVNTGGQVGIVRTLSSSTLGKTGLHLGGAFRFATERDYVAGPDGKGSVEAISGQGVRTPVNRENPSLFTGDVFCAYGILPFLDISLDMPVYYDITGWGEDMAGAGDLELALKMVYPFQKENALFSHAYYVKTLFPTGSNDRGYFPRHAYYLSNGSCRNPFTADAVFFNPMIVWTFDFEKISRLVPLQLHMNFGGIIAAQRKGSSAFLAAIGLMYTPVQAVTFFAEIAGESRVKYYSDNFDGTEINNDPLWITPGIRWNLPLGFYATLAGDIGLSDNDAQLRTNLARDGFAYSTKGTPRYGIQLSFGWSGILREDDRDGDAIIDKNDSCPKEAEDRDGFKDDDGCPDPDNDGDGFVDAQDRCPDSFGTDGGCPVYDTDNDGITDDQDKCPQEAEDKDGFQDNDGCPEADNDNDGVVDTKDNCPDVTEDLDGFEDGDGCPDTDNDGDGVQDAEDKCPGVKGLPDNNGCPKTKEISRGKLILSGVTFQAGKAILTVNSYTILDQVYESLVEWPEVKLEIQGHTDNRGNNMSNLKLSQLRADAVKIYLVQKGVQSDRLRSVGYGEEFPVADNHTAEGREKNRRVELRRID